MGDYTQDYIDSEFDKFYMDLDNPTEHLICSIPKRIIKYKRKTCRICRIRLDEENFSGFCSEHHPNPV